MAISIDLRILASKLEKSSDELIAEAALKGPEYLEKISIAIAAASTLLTSVADDIDTNLTTADLSISDLDKIATLSEKLASSNDPEIRKQANVLDEILLTIAAPKNAVAQAKQMKEDEVNELAAKYRSDKVDELYHKPKKELHEMHGFADMAKALDSQVKDFRPLEAPLQTRYSPDMPGTPMVRITDGVYQDVTTGKIFDYANGYTTAKGNKVPGSSVANQIRDLGDQRHQSSSMFETRDNILNRYVSASSNDQQYMKKFAQMDIIAATLRMVRDFKPELLNNAIDCAAEKNKLNTDEIANALSSDINSDDDERATEVFKGLVKVPPVKQSKDEQEEIAKTHELLKMLKSVGWDSMIVDLYDVVRRDRIVSNQNIVKLFSAFLPIGIVRPNSESYMPKHMSNPSPENIYDLVEMDEDDVTVDPDEEESKVETIVEKTDIDAVRKAFFERIDFEKFAQKKSQFTTSDWFEKFEEVAEPFFSEYIKDNKFDEGPLSEPVLVQLSILYEQQITSKMNSLGYPGPFEVEPKTNKNYIELAIELEASGKSVDINLAPVVEKKAPVIKEEKDPSEIYSKPKAWSPGSEQFDSAINQIKSNPSAVEDEDFWKKLFISAPGHLVKLKATIDSIPEIVAKRKQDPVLDQFIKDWFEYLEYNKVGIAPKKQTESLITDQTNKIVVELPKDRKNPDWEKYRQELIQWYKNEKIGPKPQEPARYPYSTHKGFIIYVPEEEEESLKPDSYVSVFKNVRGMIWDAYKEEFGKRLTDAQVKEIKQIIDSTMLQKGYWPPYTSITIPGARSTVKFGPLLSKKLRWASLPYEEKVVELLTEVDGKATPHKDSDEYLAAFDSASKMVQEDLPDYVEALKEKLNVKELTFAQIDAEYKSLVNECMEDEDFVAPYAIDPVSSRTWLEMAESLANIETGKTDDIYSNYLRNQEIKQMGDESGVNPRELTNKEKEEAEVRKQQILENEPYSFSLTPDQYNQWLNLVADLDKKSVNLPTGISRNDYLITKMHELDFPAPYETAPNGMTWLNYVKYEIEKQKNQDDKLQSRQIENQKRKQQFFKLLTPVDNKLKYVSVLSDVLKEVSENAALTSKLERERKNNNKILAGKGKSGDAVSYTFKKQKEDLIRELMFKKGFVSPYDIDPKSNKTWAEVMNS